MSVTPDNMTDTTTTQLRETVVADAVKRARRECVFLLVYEYKDFFKHTVWAAVSEGEQRPTDSLLICTIDEEGQVQWKVDKHVQRPIQKYITVQIYKPKVGTVSDLNTISSRFDRVALPCVDGPLDDSDIAGIPVIKLVRRIVRGREYIHAEPEGETRHASYGGCILDSSDSRFRETTGTLYPIKLHDRFEPAPISKEAQDLLRPEWNAMRDFITETGEKLQPANKQ
jgi:hypothetical protein